MNDYEMKKLQSITLTSIQDTDYRAGMTAQYPCLTYIVCGTMNIVQNGKTFTFHAGECVFVRKDLSVKMTLHTAKDSHLFKAITMNFTKNFLQAVYRNLPSKTFTVHIHRSRKAFLKIPMTHDLESIFKVILPYFKIDKQPSEEWVKYQLNEALACVLKADKNTYASIFDFAVPWKIDLIDFMNDNYMYQLPLKDLATYSGRSLSTFKRDFKKITDVTPERWLINKRLCEAQKLLSHGNKRIKEVMNAVGITNQSFFSRVYKEKFGYTPKHTPQETDKES